MSSDVVRVTKEDLDGSTDADNCLVLALARVAPHLQEFVLANVVSVSDDCVTRLAHACQGLKSIHVTAVDFSLLVRCAARGVVCDPIHVSVTHCAFYLCLCGADSTKSIRHGGSWLAAVDRHRHAICRFIRHG